MDMTRQTTEEKFNEANSYREKYLTLRKAILEAIGVPDEKLALLTALNELMGSGDEAAGMFTPVIVALIETDK